MDVEATRACCAARPLPWVTCGCAGCRNFVQTVKELPPAVPAFFEALGLDPEKPGETCWYGQVPGGVSGGAFYHLAGILLEGAPPEGLGQTGWIPVAEGFEAAFKPDCDLLPEDFSRPCFQMEWSGVFPWVLDKPNPYTD